MTKKPPKQTEKCIHNDKSSCNVYAGLCLQEYSFGEKTRPIMGSWVVPLGEAICKTLQGKAFLSERVSSRTPLES